MIFGFTFTSKKGKGELCRTKNAGFTLMLTRGTKGWRSKSAPSFMICRSERFSNTAVETATAVHLTRPEGPPTEIELKGVSKAEGGLTGNLSEKDFN